MIVTRGAHELTRTHSPVQVRPSTAKYRPAVDRVRIKYVQSEDRVSFKSCAHRQRVGDLLALLGRAPCYGAEDRGVRRRAETVLVLCLNDARPRGRRAAPRGTASARRVGGAPRSDEGRPAGRSQRQRGRRRRRGGPRGRGSGGRRHGGQRAVTRPCGGRRAPPRRAASAVVESRRGVGGAGGREREDGTGETHGPVVLATVEDWGPCTRRRSGAGARSGQSAGAVASPVRATGAGRRGLATRP